MTLFVSPVAVKSVLRFLVKFPYKINEEAFSSRIIKMPVKERIIGLLSLLISDLFSSLGGSRDSLALGYLKRKAREQVDILK